MDYFNPFVFHELRKCIFIQSQFDFLAFYRETDKCWNDLSITMPSGESMFVDRSKGYAKSTSVERSCDKPAIFEVSDKSLIFNLP